MREHPDIGRRGLLTGSYLTREGREHIERRQQVLGPKPPWHQAVAEACTSCDQQCAAACPQAIVRIHPDDHRYAGQPWLQFSTTGCTFCGDCAEACPAIESYERESASIGELQLNNASCLSWNNVFCMSCIGKCDARALRMDERRRPVLQYSMCTGCGMCIHVCPVDALHFQSIG
jgi:ferredoxin-type protein NapF